MTEPAASTAPPRQDSRVAAMLGLGSAIAFAGLILPWVRVDIPVGEESASLSQSGIATDDGKIVLAIVLLLSFAAMRYFSGRVRRVVALGATVLLLSTIVTLVGFADIADIRSSPGRNGIRPTVGFGLYLTAAGGLIALAGAMTALRARNQIGPGREDDRTVPPVPPATGAMPPSQPPTGLPSEQAPPPPPAP